MALNSNLINTHKQTSIIDFLKSKLYEIGENISLISYFDNSMERLETFKIKNYDFAFIIGSSSPIYNNNIKENLCRIFNDKLENFETSYSSLNKYCNSNNITFSMQEEMEVKLPKESIPLCDSAFYNNGFMYKLDNTYIVYLPDDIDFTKEMYGKYILPLLNDLIKVTSDHVVLKCFGILEKDIKALLSEFYNDSRFVIQIRSEGLDTAIFIRYELSLDDGIIRETVSNICSKLSKFIYATEDISLYDLAIELLNLRGKNISIAETFTYGNITKKLVNKAKNRIKESFLFTTYDSIIKYMKVDTKVIDKYGEYSVNTIYELANALLEVSSSDISLFVLGDTDKGDICYIAIGDIEGIHVYKNKINDISDELIENISKTAIFYLIKKLKRNDLQM